MRPKSPLNRRRSLRCRAAGIGSGVLASVSAPLGGLYIHDHNIRAAVLQLIIGVLSALLCADCWLLWKIPIEAFRLAIPSTAGRGGCSRCSARFLQTKYDDDGTPAGLMVWHEESCIDGARFERRELEHSR